MKIRRQSGFSLLELMFGIGLSLTVAGVSIAMWRVSQERANANASVNDFGRIRGEIGRIYNTTSQEGYGSLTAENLRSRGADLEDLWVAAQTSYRLGASTVTVGPGNRVPGGTGNVGDSYRIVIQAAKPQACTQMMLASIKDAVAAEITDEGGTTTSIAGLPGNATEASIQQACNRPPSVRMQLDFNT